MARDKTKRGMGGALKGERMLSKGTGQALAPIFRPAKAKTAKTYSAIDVGRSRPGKGKKIKPMGKANPGMVKEYLALVRDRPPHAIETDDQHREAVDAIDRLMSAGKLSRAQELYLETLVQLVQAYEAKAHPIERVSGIELLRHVLDENGMNGSGLARLLGVDISMGSKILSGDRALTLEHVKKLAERFGLSPAAFID